MNKSYSPLNKGITLIELLVAVSIVVLLGIVVSSVQIDVFRFNRTITGSLSSIDRAQRLLRPMTAEIRSASISGLGAFPIATAAPTEFAFYSDIDSDGKKEYVRYYLSGTTLYKQVVRPSSTLPPVYDTASASPTVFIENVQNGASQTPIFRYFSGAYIGGEEGEVLAPENSIESIRMVRISLLVQSVGAQQTVTIGTDVTIRNLKQQ